MIHRWIDNISNQFSFLKLLPNSSRNLLEKENKITIDFGSGTLTEGFTDVTIQLFNLDLSLKEKQTISLSSEPDLESLLQKWRASYISIYGAYDLRGDIQLDLSRPTNVSDIDIEEFGEQLQQSLNRWLLTLELQLLYLLQTIEKAKIIIITNDEQLQRLPWHLWNLFDSKKCVEYALSASNYQQQKKSRTPEGTVRILAVFGNASGINLNKDRQTLSSLPNADVCVLDKPDRITLDRTLRDAKSWDILFFAGHSNTVDGSGVLKINDKDNLSTKQLKSCLTTATANGTQLAIFNSCDGLGLARALGGIGLSHIIVMGEPIPDTVAQVFITSWLTEFAKGKSFYTSTREAREQLKILEKDYPCASWLPVVFQNPTAQAPSWQKFRSVSQVPWRVPVTVGIAIAGLVTGVRSTGILQYPELKTYDTFLSWRKDEGIDPRVLVVTGQDEERFGYPFRDEVIAETIETIGRFQPRVIGLDLTRDIAKKDTNNRLKQVFSDNKIVTSACVQEEKELNQQASFGSERMGFANLYEDNAGNVIRRVSLFSTPSSNDLCRADSYLGTKLAFDYLAQDSVLPKTTTDGEVKIGVQKYRSLPSYMGIYQRKGHWGYETLINYRMGITPFQVVSIADVLDGKVDPSLVRDRIVIVGMDLVNTDRHDLPFKDNRPGVEIVAHVTSQILDNASGKKPAIWTLPFSIEIGLILLVSISGGIIACYQGDRKVFWIVLGTGLFTIPGSCWFVLQAYGLLMPVIPIGLSFVGSYLVVRSDSFKQHLNLKS